MIYSEITAAMEMNMLGYIKFFEKDVRSGSCEKNGAVFTAMFFGGERQFTVVDHKGDHFFAEISDQLL
jgi:hypothetical protein